MVSSNSTDPTLVDDHHEVTSIVADRAFPLLLETYLYALYTILTVYFVYRRWFDRKTTSLPVFMLLVTLAMFGLFTAYWAIDVYLLWIEVYRYLPQQRTEPEVMFLDGLWIPWSTAYYVQTAFQFMMLVLGDTVSLWRAYAVWGRPRWLFILFICIAVVESCAYIWVLVALFAQSLPQSSKHGFSYNFYAKSYDTSFIVSNVITACAQLFATLLIAYKAWFHWREVREFSNQKQVKQSIAMLVVIIESGVLYFALLLWYGLIDYLGSPDSLVYTSVFYYTTPLIAMYPTLVVVLVATRRSVLECSIVSESFPTSDLHFAANRSVHEDRNGTMSKCPTCHRDNTSVSDSTTPDTDVITWNDSEQNAAGVYDKHEGLEKRGRALQVSMPSVSSQGSVLSLYR